MESELFGYERGAFAGALKTKKGLIELADGGTVFLDEIGELPMAMQTKLLTFLDDRKFKRIGALEDTASMFGSLRRRTEISRRRSRRGNSGRICSTG